MALRFRCEFCGKDILVKYLKIGEEAVCPYCGEHMIVPNEAAEMEMSPDERPLISTIKRSAFPVEDKPVEITSPWTGILFYPRQAVRLALEGNRKKEAYVLAAVYGIVYNLHLVWRYGVGVYSGVPLWLIVASNILFGALFGYGTLYVYSWILSGVSKLLGGLKSANSARIALGWSCMPYVALLVIIPLMFIDPGTFVYHPKGEMFSSGLSRAYFGLRSLMTIWFLVIVVSTTSEAMELSMPRTLLAFLILFILMMLMTVALLLLFGALFW
jgi:DNA-directed RNA polymerase subunit RPC12/RpoP